MPTNTYVALATHTVPSSVASYTFTSIPQGYTDLILVINGKHSANQNEDYGLRFNSDTGSNYSSTYLLGSGTSALSGRASNQTKTISGWLNATDIGTYIEHIQNYSNNTTYKTVLSRGAQTDSDTYMNASVSLWRNTAAITSITVVPAAASLASGMTLSLYGILAEGVSPAAKATGGAIYSDSLYYYHVFGSTGTFTPLSSLTADVLVVAGGGGGSAAGGGAGGLLAYTSQSLTATGYTCTVGGGGALGNSGSALGATGGNSQFGGLTAASGGGGGSNYGGSPSTVTGGAGGSGGGGTSRDSASSGAGGAASPSGQGNAGGVGADSSAGAVNGGGGGGAGAVGGTTTFGSGGAGGIGSSTYSSWGLATGTGENVSSTVYYAGGGRGESNFGSSLGANGYGNGKANTGGGGMCASSGGGDGFAGQSGIVIVRYLKA